MKSASPAPDLRTELSRRYNDALQCFLKQCPGASLEPARELGRQAIRDGLETLDLARIHEIALTALVLPHFVPSRHDGLMSRAAQFFAEALTPIEETHRGAKEANTHLNNMIAALNERTRELAASVEELKLEIAQRTAMEESLRLSEQNSSALLVKSCDMQKELRMLSHKLLSVQEEERRRISRELHDVIAQTLSGINVRLATLKAEATTDGKNLQKKITSTQKLVERSVKIVHRFARELRPSVLDDLGLIPALQTYLKTFMEDTGIRVSLQAYAEVEKAGENTRTALYRIAQEALSNVARHAKASRARVSIVQHEDLIRMEITDDGHGFEVEGTTGASKKGNRLGLLGMRERIEMIGGTFCIESAPDRPTTVRVEVPRSGKAARRFPKKKTASSPTLECS